MDIFGNDGLRFYLDGNNIEITLITCNKSNNTKRVVVKAKVTE